jgi:hypothetical protein
LNDKDIGRAKEPLKYRWFQKKAWQDEIKRMLASGLKLPAPKAQRGRLVGLESPLPGAPNPGILLAIAHAVM